jgi:hypothetical protein
LHKYVYSNIVTLQKGNEICCITETTDYPIFIDPPAKMINNNKPVKFLKQDNWNNDNWLLEDVSNFSHGAVTDKRWEGELLKNNVLTFYIPYNLLMIMQFAIITFLVLATNQFCHLSTLHIILYRQKSKKQTLS